MAKPFRKGGRWYARAKDGTGAWKNVALPEARTKADAERLQADLSLRFRRQRDGLEPLPPIETFTVAKLLGSWLSVGLAGRPAQSRTENRIGKHLENSELGRLPVARLSLERIEAFLQERGAHGLSAVMQNHLRADLRTAWNWACGVGLLTGPNPTARVKPRKVTERTPSFLEPAEVARLLRELQGSDRWMVATLCLSAVRKGELFGLRKSDVDLGRGLLMVRRSYGRGTTKAGKERAVPIASPLVPFLEQALAAAKGELLFPRPDGSMRAEQDGLGRRMRRALGRAGIVTGYLHSCRRCQAAVNRNVPGAAVYEEQQPDNRARFCPKCKMSLFVAAIPKPLRLHDTRHTTATLLLAAGADLWGVSKILGHADASITSRVYGHLVPGYLKGQADRLTSLFGGSASVPDAVGTQRASTPSKGEAEGGSVASVPCPPKAEPIPLLLVSNGFASPVLPSRKKRADRRSGDGAKSAVLEGFLMEREIGIEPTTFSLGS
jgi:integrase